MLATERRDLKIDLETVWPMLDGVPLSNIVVLPLSPIDAEMAFFDRWDELNQRIAS